MRSDEIVRTGDVSDAAVGQLLDEIVRRVVSALHSRLHPAGPDETSDETWSIAVESLFAIAAGRGTLRGEREGRSVYFTAGGGERRGYEIPDDLPRDSPAHKSSRTLRVIMNRIGDRVRRIKNPHGLPPRSMEDVFDCDGFTTTISHDDFQGDIVELLIEIENSGHGLVDDGVPLYFVISRIGGETEQAPEAAAPED